MVDFPNIINLVFYHGGPLQGEPEPDAVDAFGQAHGK